MPRTPAFWFVLGTGASLPGNLEHALETFGAQQNKTLELLAVLQNEVIGLKGGMYDMRADVGGLRGEIVMLKGQLQQASVSTTSSKRSLSDLEDTPPKRPKETPDAADHHRAIVGTPVAR